MKTRDIRGVNLGGWLVLERWMTPSVFVGLTVEDEYSLCAELGEAAARKRLEKHRATFITERHMKQIKALGLNAVRVPVGYWLFEDVDGFIGGSDKYLDRLFVWAEKYGLDVLLCLHGAPGSQNGWDHSGRAGTISWGRSTLQQTLQCIDAICRRYGQHQRLYGIELLNEPHPSLPIRGLIRYYRRAAIIVRRYCHPGVRWVVSDAFRPRSMIFRIFLNWFRHPVLDQHMYQLFTPEDRALDFSGHLRKAKKWHRELMWRTQFLPVIVGEWSVAMDENYQPELKKNAQTFTVEQYATYALIQRTAFEKAGCGWFYWTARVEDKGPWSLLDHPEFLTK